MEVKTFEIRDRHTFIPALAVRLMPGGEQDRYLIARAGFGILPDTQGDYVILVRLDAPAAQHDPYSWHGGRTMQTSHSFIRSSWSELKSGQVIDVEYILGETTEPARSESERIES